MKTVNRHDTLAGQFDDFMNRVAKTNGVDYYSRLSTRDFVELKNVLSNINNIITLHITHAFAEWLRLHGVVDEVQYDAICADIESTSANANGFDVLFSDKIGNTDGIVAEVKCNIPVKPDRFGAAQLTNLKKDVDGLLHGKTKAKELGKTKAKRLDTKNYLKFLVLLDDGGRVRPSAEHFVKTLQGNGYNIVIVDKPQILRTDTIYTTILNITKG